MEKSLYELIKNGFGKEEGLNCAEKILHGANQVYKLNIAKDDLKMAAGFGGGMAVGGVCGIISGAVMAFSKYFVKEKAHESTKIKEVVSDYIKLFKESESSENCRPLKEKYFVQGEGCRDLILKGANIFDIVMKKHSWK